jgi:hypothetical protein
LKKLSIQEKLTEILKQYLEPYLGPDDEVNVIVQDEKEWKKGLEQRAKEYAKGIKTPYWGNEPIKILALPAMPNDGSTDCTAELGRKCNCKWEIKVINAKNGDYDAYWTLGPDSQDIEIKDYFLNKGHCQDCQTRAVTWNPLKIRGGEFQPVEGAFPPDFRFG